MGLKARPHTGPWCPVSVRSSGSPVRACQKRTDMSEPDVVSTWPSGLNATPVTEPTCPESTVPVRALGTSLPVDTWPFSARRAASHNAWNSALSPRSSSTISSRWPHLGTRGPRKTLCTVAWLRTPVPNAAAICRTAGSPAWKWSSCSRSNSTLTGPGGVSARFSTPIRQAYEFVKRRTGTSTVAPADRAWRNGNRRRARMMEILDWVTMALSAVLSVRPAVAELRAVVGRVRSLRSGRSAPARSTKWGQPSS